jgi:sarcosine oxidase gamma subunit
LIRAIGPTLANLGIQNALATPAFTLFNAGGHSVLHNSGWNGEPALAAAFSVVGAFPLPTASKDAAALILLSPGNYTVQVGGGAGEVLLEIYLVE